MSCGYVDDPAKERRVQDLSKDTLRLPKILCAMVRDQVVLDIWHTVWCWLAIDL